MNSIFKLRNLEKNDVNKKKNKNWKKYNYNFIFNDLFYCFLNYVH